MIHLTNPVFGTSDGAKQEERRYKLKCPHHVSGCTGLFDYTHLMMPGSLSDRFGPWYCDECGWATTATNLQYGNLQVTALPERRVRTLVLLMFVGATSRNEPLFLVTQGMSFEKNGKAGLDEARDKYYYEEHTCPSNFVHAEVLAGDDADPHGIFQHLETVVMPDDWRERDTQEIGDYEKLFATLRRSKAMYGQPVKLIMADLIRHQQEQRKIR